MTVGQRLSLARLALHREVGDIAEAAELSEEDLLSYEHDEQEPDPDVLLRLAQELGTELSFFLRTPPVVDLVPISPQLDKFGEAEQEVLIAQSRLWLERALDIESFFPAEQLPLPEHPEGFPYPVGSGADAAHAAQLLRDAWLLSILPIYGMSDLLESRGIRIGYIDGVDGFDACAFLSDDEFGFPLITVRLDAPGDVQRFAIARELAYFMLADATPQVASHFAGAFLMPADAIRQELGEHRTRIELYELYLLKQKYGMSMRTLLVLATNLRIISKEYFEEQMQIFRDEGWAEQEPGLEYPSEAPTRLVRMVMRLQAEGEISEGRAAGMLGLSDDEWFALVTFGGEEEEPEAEAVE